MKVFRDGTHREGAENKKPVTIFLWFRKKD